MGWLRRYRNSRGFGVHSPFGYMLAREVILPDPHYKYYSEDMLRRSALALNYPWKRFQIAARFLRLGIKLRFKEVALPSSYFSLLKAPFQRALPNIRILKSADKAEANAGALFEADEDMDSILRFLSRPGNAAFCLGRTQEDADRIFEAMDCGLLICGKHNLLAINRGEMQKISYQMYV